ncbi:flagellar type III secretion system protein FliR [Mesorhizobium sp. B2-2-4]|uniref:flagellar biosynthetic protein FliR n=1 Tax=unclassified Mesorhizobium TaxID=325217 RepID=UPI001129EF71|nr:MULTISPECIES: flagellar biosynthetic protein FliR [unclassified Mesorhizobium]TPM21210.1 flagellar type III secretion system protein FliR [Mesorhizobium sp. B2-3-6]TPM51974.1 flagellar type III secretion system protein FliR [Mesorhizobium sp. B2-2-4]TPM60149.1 flagellar type III secretion system protein FliR [Mesorhizobium sp. B2-2-1]TPN66218.1 flagellar type III secretion system protein FliR [Mesorhizobium sp. B1-1-3]
MSVLSQAVVIAAFLAFCRIGACFMLMPGLSSARIPVQVRLFVAVAATAGLLAFLWDKIFPFVDPRPQILVPMIVSELLVGGLIGAMTRLYMEALRFMGSAIAMLIGYGGSGGPAIEEPEPQAALAAMISFSALLLLFVFDFDHEIIRALVTSYTVAPVNVFFNPQAALVDVADTVSDTFFLVIRLGSPFVAYAILVNLTIGFVNKLTPQIPIYFISQPFVIAGGMLIFYFAVGSMLSLFVDGFVDLTLAR